MPEAGSSFSGFGGNPALRPRHAQTRSGRALTGAAGWFPGRLIANR